MQNTLQLQLQLLRLRYWIGRLFKRVDSGLFTAVCGMLLLSALMPRPLPCEWFSLGAEDYGATFLRLYHPSASHENQLKKLSLETSPHNQGFY